MQIQQIQDGPPILRGFNHTDAPGIEARALCLVDGYAAEIRHVVDTRHQEYNRHTLSIFNPRDMVWTTILSWGFNESQHVPIHPDTETLAHLRQLSEVMWSMANVIVGQSRRRQEYLDTAQHADERMEYQQQLDTYLDERMVDLESFPTVEKGVMMPPITERIHDEHAEEFSFEVNSLEGDPGARLADRIVQYAEAKAAAEETAKEASA